MCQALKRARYTDTTQGPPSEAAVHSVCVSVLYVLLTRIPPLFVGRLSTERERGRVVIFCEREQ